MDFDPRDYDSRDDERFNERHRGGRDSSHDYDRDDDLRLPDTHARDRDEAREQGRGPGDESHRSNSDEHRHDPRDDARWSDRDRESRGREFDPREAFMRNLNLPRSHERHLVHYRDREYSLRGSESRTLAAVGAFRVVSSRDLRDNQNRPTDPRSGDLRHLREQGLVKTVRVAGYRDHAVVLTKEGRGLLESHRHRDEGDRQTFYDGLRRERELEHDVQVYRAYEREAERLNDRGASVERVLLDYELKREYQSWLHERDHDREDYDGHPDRDEEEIRDWACEHDLPYFDDQVHFPDVRIEYREVDGRLDHLDVEVVTQHYRGAHGAAVSRSAFISFGGSSANVGGAPFDPSRWRR